MKAFDLDWARMIDLAGAWSKLPVMARRALLDKLLQVSPSTHVNKLGTNAQPLVDAGFAVRMTLHKDYIHLNSEYQSPLTAMRAMNRFKIFDDERIKLQAYLSDIFTQAECAELVGIQGYDMYRGPSVLAERAVSPQWLDAFLALKRLPRDLPYKPKRDGDRLKALQMDPGEIHRAAQTLVKHLMSSSTPVPLAEIPVLLPNVDRAILAHAIHEAIRYVVIFPALREADLEPVLGIWPAITWRLKRPLPSKPDPLAATPDHPVDIPFLMEDITTLLVACAKEPLRLRTESGTLFSKACADIQEGMVTLPDWYSRFAGYMAGQPEDEKCVSFRIDRAFRLTLELKLTKSDRNADKKDALIVNPTGMEWLSKNPKERLKTLLDVVHIQTKPLLTRYFPGNYYRAGADGYFTDHFIWGGQLGNYWPHNWRVETHESKIKKAVVDAFDTLGTDAFYSLDKFLTYQSQAENPLPDLIRKSPNGEEPRYSYGGFDVSDEQLETIWAETLLRIFWRWLAPFGGVAVAANADGETPEFRVTGIGRYLLGLADDFEFAAHSADTGVLVVQPNFELVFLSPSPAIEAACTRFCERAGKSRSIGTLFRITRKSIHAAAGAGMTPDGVFEILAKAASKALPRNVEHEIKGWFAQCRNVAVRSATLVECPDEETAAKVARCWSGTSVRLNSTVVELRASEKKAEIAKKLRALGVFVKSKEHVAGKGEFDGEL